MKSVLAGQFVVGVAGLLSSVCGQVVKEQVAVAVSPAAMATVKVWPEGKMPGKGAGEAEMEKPSKDRFHRITNVSEPTLAFFPAPATEGGAAPVVIVCPGGGYAYVVIDKEGTEIAGWLNSMGVSAVVLKYRNPNNRDGAMQDLQRSLSLVRSKAAEWKIDAKRVGVIGFSAGGNLAAKAGAPVEPRSYAEVDEVDKNSCRPDFVMLVYPAYLGSEKEGLATNLNLKADIPPTLIVHTEDDKGFVVGSKLYAAALKEKGSPHFQFLLYKTGGHGYGLHCGQEAKVWPEAAGEWMKSIGMR